MLTRWDPFRDMLSMRRAMDRLFDRALEPSWSETPAWDLALDVVENKDEFLVKASLPGINPDDLEITFTDNTLTIKGSTKSEVESKDARYHLRERRYGSFARSITLGSRIQGDAIQANYENGVLTLTLPKAEEVKAKRIQIHMPKMIDAKSKNSK